VSFGKNRIHSTLATPALPSRTGVPPGFAARTVAGGAREYALSLDTDSDIFSAKWRPQLLQLLQHLPAETHRCVAQ